MYTPMSRACAAKLVMKSRVGGEPAMAARTAPPWAGHLSMAAASAVAAAASMIAASSRGVSRLSMGASRTFGLSCLFTCRSLLTGPAPRREARGEPPASVAPLALVLGLLGHEAVQGRHRSRDLFLPDLEPAPGAVARHAVERLVHELLGRRPRGGRHVHVQLLEEGGGHEVPPA